ncbi:MAG: class I SAM-dependent methyltransferase [Pseudomonadota bacterium]
MIKQATISERKTEELETIPAADLIRSWQSDFSIDTGHLFSGIETIRMVRDTDTGIVAFDPPVLGDAAFYNALRAFKWYHPPTKEEYAEAASWHRPSDRIIDVGAGHGGFADHVPQNQYFGLETDPQAVSNCKSRGLNVLNASMADYRDRPDAMSADLVTAFQVLEHVSAPDLFIDDMASLASPGGRLVIGVPDAESYVSDLPDFMLNAPPHHITWWTEASLTGLLKSKGMQILAVQRFRVEPWERQLWWMAWVARIARPKDGQRFGSGMRARKVVSYILSLLLQIIRPPRTACGSTLLVIAEKKKGRD